MLKTLPLGRASEIGEHGGRLSGGQRQRISISRGLYRDAPILILDEATSALDNIAENRIRRVIAKLTSNRTVIMIAHRLTTVIDADCIHVLNGGRIVEIWSASRFNLGKWPLQCALSNSTTRQYRRREIGVYIVYGVGKRGDGEDLVRTKFFGQYCSFRSVLCMA